MFKIVKSIPHWAKMPLIAYNTKIVRVNTKKRGEIIFICGLMLPTKIF
jgi:hypothetical protein